MLLERLWRRNALVIVGGLATLGFVYLIAIFRESAIQRIKEDMSLPVYSEHQIEGILKNGHTTSHGMQKSMQKSDLFADDYTPPAILRMVSVLKGCGEICNTTIVGEPSLFFPQIRKRVNCRGILLNGAIDEPRAIGPAPRIPPEMRHAFSYNGRVSIIPYSAPDVLFNDQYLGGVAKSPEWGYSLVEDWKRDCKLGKLGGTYGSIETAAVFAGLGKMETVKNGHVLVIGSENPWVEACILAVGASLVTTLEYGNITSLHPQIRTMTPPEMRRLYAHNLLPLFDAVVTFSSIEHSGLGRYGDELNPWGDLQAIARAWCVTKPRGELLIGVPTDNVDRIEFNAHRVYGPLMYSHLVANWKQKWCSSTGSHPLHILKRMGPVI